MKLLRKKIPLLATFIILLIVAFLIIMAYRDAHKFRDNKREIKPPLTSVSKVVSIKVVGSTIKDPKEMNWDIMPVFTFVLESEQVHAFIIHNP